MSIPGFDVPGQWVPGQISGTNAEVIAYDNDLVLLLAT
jgi:hypothetical protein